jgi:putative aldouronate transport system substrate-binding protein
MKKATIIAASIIGLLILAGCGGGKKAAVKAIEAEPGPLGRYKEPLVLTWGINSSSVQKFFNGDTFENNVWSRRIKQDLNIDVKVGFEANWETGAFRNQLTLALASGEIPDLLRIDNYRQFREAVDGGLVADITDAFNQYASPELKEILARYPSAREYATVNGRLYGFPPFNGNEQHAPLLWIRDSWLKKVGMQPPKTVDEMIAVARAFTFNDPDGNGKNDTYGLALQTQINARDHGTIGGLLSAFGIPNHAYDLYYIGKDGKITTPYIQPEVKEALRVLQNMYKEGLIDPEFITTDMTGLQQKIAQNRYGMAYGPNWGTWSPWNYVYNAEHDWAVTHVYAIPTQAGYAPKYGYANNQAAGVILTISSRTGNPEALVKLINHYITILNDFTPDDIRKEYNDDEQYRFNPAQIAEPGEIRQAPILIDALTRKDPSGLSLTNQQYYRYINDFEANPAGQPPDVYGRWGSYALSMSMPIIINQYIPSGGMVESLLGAEQPESLHNFDAALQKITDQTFFEIIMGQRPVDYFDTFVEQWLTAGGRQVLDDLDKIYGSGAAR